MSRSLADPLYERLLRSFPPERAYTRADWEGEEMPAPVAHFLSQLLQHYARREARRLRRARTEWVDYDDPEMEKAVRTFFDGIDAHTRVPADEWEDTLRQATRHATAHLVRPVYVLTDFVFGEQEDDLRLSEILWRMNFFGPYIYLRKAVRAFADKKDLDGLDAGRYNRLLQRVDERITADFGADRWLRLLGPLFTVAQHATGEKQVPVILLRAFFAEKGARAIERRLERYAEEGAEEIGRDALHRLIDEGAVPQPSEGRQPSDTETDKRPPTRPDQVPPEPERADDSEAEVVSDEDMWGVAGPSRPEGEGGPSLAPPEEESEPLWKQFQEGHSNPASNGDESGDETSQEPLWAQYRRDRDEQLTDGRAAQQKEDLADAEASFMSDSSPPPPETPTVEADEELEDLEKNVLGESNPPHRAVYLRQLFTNDETAYRQVLQRLRKANTWGEASQIIARDVFRKYKVNIYSDAAVHFTNAVESRFRR